MKLITYIAAILTLYQGLTYAAPVSITSRDDTACRARRDLGGEEADERGGYNRLDKDGLGFLDPRVPQCGRGGYNGVIDVANDEGEGHVDGTEEVLSLAGSA